MRAEKKRLTYMDFFGRKYYCTHARRGTVRYCKKSANKKIRQIYKKSIDKELDIWYNVYIERR